jgi:hypothetical protein
VAVAAHITMQLDATEMLGEASMEKKQTLREVVYLLFIGGWLVFVCSNCSGMIEQLIP